MTGTPKLGASRSARCAAPRCRRQAREVLAHLPLNVAREARAAVVHREDHSGDRQPRVELAADQRERVEQLRESLEREVLRLHGHDDLVCRDQCVDGQRAERRRAIEEREQVALADVAKTLAQDRLRARDARELDVGPGQVRRRRRHVEPLHPARHRRLPERELAGETVVDVRLAVLRQPKRNRCIALRVEVGEQGRIAGVGDAGAEVDGGGRLSDPALLVGDCENAAHRG